MNKSYIDAIQDISWRIELMIADIKEEKTDSLKVRPGYGYDKFYLDWVDGSYDMSLHSLINFMLQKHRYYRKLLSRETFRKISKFNKRDPVGLYDFSENEDEQDLIDSVNTKIICAVRLCLKKYQFDDDAFVEAEYDDVSVIPHISEFGLVGTTVVYLRQFIDDLSHYIAKNTLTQCDIDNLYKVFERSGHDMSIASLLYEKYTKISMDIQSSAIKECTKKSECTLLSVEIKKISNDPNLLEELRLFKEKL